MRAGWRRRLQGRVPLMVGSLVAAVFFWFVITMREKVEVGFMAPLVFAGFPDRLAADGAPIESVYVRLRGTRDAVERVEPLGLRVVVSLAGARAGNNVLRLTPEMVAVPPGVVVVAVSPPAVNLRLLERRGDRNGGGP